MARLLFAKGAVGELVRRMQFRLGFTGSDLDGWFGNQTRDAVVAFQRRTGLTESGEVDVDGWTALMGEPVPSVRERCLQLTAHFEGHAFTLAQGNFDGAGITWGIIGFTLKGGELGRIVLETEARFPGLLRQAFGTTAGELREIVRKPWPEQLAFADSISFGSRKTRLAEPWRTSFRRLGEMPEVQQLQIERAREGYYEPALATAKRWGLESELGIALAFDVHVQNGGIKAAAKSRIEAALGGRQAADERALRIVIANAVADSARLAWREDVRERKLAIATGAGPVHGGRYELRNWGLEELPA